MSAEGLSNIDVLYIPSSYNGAAAMAARSRRAGVPVLSGTKSFLGKGGAIAVVSEGGKPRIYISQSGAKGLMSLDSKLVRLAKLVP